MANTYTALVYHIVFGTKRREPSLTPAIRTQLWPYLGGIARKNDMCAYEIGGVADHIHVLASIPPTIAIAKAVQLIKGGSSHWLKSTFPELGDFEWQDGYSAFTVSHSQMDAVQTYIRDQEEHPRTKSFAEEYRAFLTKHGVEFDERYLLG